MTDRSTLTTLTLLIAATMTIMAGATIAPALPEIDIVFGPDEGLRVRLLLTITALAIAIGAPVAGALGDRLGRVRVLGGSVLLYLIAGSAGLYLSDLTFLLASRVLLGLAVAGVMTSVGGLIGDLYDGPARDRMLGLQGAAMGFGGVIFLGLGGVLASIGWRAPFLIYLLPAVLLILIPRALADAPKASGSPDTTAPVATLPMTTVLTIATAAFVGMIAFYTTPVQLPFLLAERGVTSPTASGAMLAGLTLVSALTGLAYGRIAARAGRRVLSSLTFLSIGAGLALIGAIPTIGTLAGLALVGLGMGLMMPTLSRWLLSATPPPARGRAMGVMTSALFAGQFLSPLLLAPAIAAYGLPAAFLVSAALSMLVAVCLWAVPDTAPSPQKGPVV